MVFALLSPLRILNFTISWSLQSRQPLILTSSGSLPFFVTVRSNRAPLPAVSSITWVWMFSSMLSRNLQGCALPPADIGMVTVCCEDQNQRMGGCERPHRLVFPDQRRHPLYQAPPSPWRCLIPWARAAPSVIPQQPALFPGWGRWDSPWWLSHSLLAHVWSTYSVCSSDDSK